MEIRRRSARRSVSTMFPFTIAGVTAPECFGVAAGSSPMVYIPMVNRLALNSSNEKKMFIDAHSYWVDVMGRLRQRDHAFHLIMVMLWEQKGKLTFTGVISASLKSSL